MRFYVTRKGGFTRWKHNVPSDDMLWKTYAIEHKITHFNNKNFWTWLAHLGNEGEIKLWYGRARRQKPPIMKDSILDSSKRYGARFGENLTKSVLAFFESGILPKAINTTWVTLIPKLEGAAKVSKYRPISMVGSIYKVISKVMALRLRKVLLFLVGET